jgi:uncharacterized protein YbaP (TraB family)
MRSKHGNGLLPAIIGALGLALSPAAWAATAPAGAPSEAAAQAAKPDGAAAPDGGAAPRPDRGTSPHPDRGTTPRPAIWLLADEDTRIYLFGTIHMLPPDLQWRSAAFENVVREADELVLEVADDADPDQIAALAPMMMLAEPRSILERVSPDRRQALGEMIRSVDMPVEMFDGMQTWAAAMTLAVASLAQALAGPDGSPQDITGVEDELRVDFSDSRRPISGVESGMQQMGFLSGLSPQTQREMLEEMVDSFAAGDPDFAAPGEEGWLRGDTADIAGEMEEMPAELFDVLITRRNRAWTEWLAERLERPGTVLFAVGAGHLAGRDSVQSMLAERGLSVTRLN